MNEKAQKLIELVNGLRELFPGQRIDVDYINSDAEVTIYAFDFATYETGTEFMRALGIGDRKKEPNSDGSCRLTGMLTDNIRVRCFCATLPPTCRLVTKTRQVPKHRVERVETTIEGEYETIEETEVVCDGGNDEAKEKSL